MGHTSQGEGHTSFLGEEGRTSLEGDHTSQGEEEVHTWELVVGTSSPWL